MLYKLLSIANTVFVNSEPNFNDVDQKISKESNTDNYSDWNTSDSSSDNDDDTNEVFDKENESVNIRKSSRHGKKFVKKGYLFMKYFHECILNLMKLVSVFENEKGSSPKLV